MNKLCIFSAGRGTRNNNVDGLHKALLPIENKPTISHIIEKFDKAVEIVIAVGYKSEQIKSYVVQALVIVYCVVNHIYKNHLYLLQ